MSMRWHRMTAACQFPGPAGLCCCSWAPRTNSSLSWLQAVADGKLRITPDRFVATWNRWLGGIRDWCISRQLWWGHRIPVWYLFPSQQVADESPDGRSADYVVARDEAAAVQAAQARCASDCRL